MSGVCNQCGLPQDLCVCETIAREQQKIVIRIEKKKFGKKYTIIDGIKKEANVDEIFKKLKNKFACGGSCKEGFIILQGEHKEKVRKYFITVGYPAEIITVI